MMRHLRLATLLALLLSDAAADSAKGPIRPYEGNRFYWEYNGTPVLLLGASVVDNLHHWPDAATHLDDLHAAGVNYVRVSLARGTRAAHGGDNRPLPHDQPFLQLANGRYDLMRPDPIFWARLETLLDRAHDRGMIVELKLFNRFDHWRGFWVTSAWNPLRNINYTEAETGLAPEYLAHPTEDRQPFFHSVPDLADIPVLLAFQRVFVDQVLDLTLGDDNILYTINNETSTDPAWGRYWIAHIRARAQAEGKEVYITDMFEEHSLSQDVFQQRVASRPDLYDFASVAQVTSMRNSALSQKDEILQLRQRMSAAPRPVTLSKLYGADSQILTDYRRREFKRHGDRAAIHSFWMSLMGGVAAIRFHRFDAGLGPSDRALATIRAARLMQRFVSPWEMHPSDDLLGGNESILVAAQETALGRSFDLPEAHAMADPGQSYVVFFTRAGQVDLDVEAPDGTRFELRWIGIDSGTLRETGLLHVDASRVTLSAPGPGAWLAILTRSHPAGQRPKG